MQNIAAPPRGRNTRQTDFNEEDYNLSNHSAKHCRLSNKGKATRTVVNCFFAKDYVVTKGKKPGCALKFYKGDEYDMVTLLC